MAKVTKLELSTEFASGRVTFESGNVQTFNYANPIMTALGMAPPAEQVVDDARNGELDFFDDYEYRADEEQAFIEAVGTTLKEYPL